MELPASAAPYSPFADWLSKFYLASEPIQALWIVALAAVALGTVWLVTRAVTETLARFPGRHRPAGRLVLGVYRDQSGRLLLYREGQGATEVNWREPQRPLVRGVIRAFGAPDAEG